MELVQRLVCLRAITDKCDVVRASSGIWLAHPRAGYAVGRLGNGRRDLLITLTLPRQKKSSEVCALTSSAAAEHEVFSISLIGLKGQSHLPDTRF